MFNKVERSIISPIARRERKNTKGTSVVEESICLSLTDEERKVLRSDLKCQISVTQNLKTRDYFFQAFFRIQW